jgi:hypothetical protein
MAIHKVDDGYVISADSIWLPGLYESARAQRDTPSGFASTFRRRCLSCGQGAHRPGWKKGDPLVFDK